MTSFVQLIRYDVRLQVPNTVSIPEILFQIFLGFRGFDLKSVPGGLLSGDYGLVFCYFG